MHNASYGCCVWWLLCSAILHSRTDSLRSHVSLHGAVDPSSLCYLGKWAKAESRLQQPQHPISPTPPTHPKYCSQTDIPLHPKKPEGPSPQPCTAAKDHPLSSLNWTLAVCSICMCRLGLAHCEGWPCQMGPPSSEHVVRSDLSSEKQEWSSGPTEQHCKNSCGAAWWAFWRPQSSSKPPDWPFETEQCSNAETEEEFFSCSVSTQSVWILELLLTGSLQ